MLVTTGNRYKVTTPVFVKTFGQGKPPEGLSIKTNEGTLKLKWGLSFEADVDMTDMSLEISNTLYVRGDIVEQLLKGDKPTIKLTKALSGGN